MSEPALNTTDVRHASSDGAVEALAGALRSVPPREREAFCLFYKQGLSVRAIAVRLRVPHAEARSLLHRARERMRSALRPRLQEEMS